MEKITNLDYLYSISIEIGSKCNLCKEHNACPASVLNRNDNNIMSVVKIIDIMDEASSHGFKGFFAFHFYNEPLIYIERIADIYRCRPDYKYLLWTNGTLIKSVVERGFSLDMFDKIEITKYEGVKEDYLPFIIGRHVAISPADMDNRLNHYSSNERNYFACKKITVELPIDCYGNVYICTYDWQGKYTLGNVNNNSLLEILNTEQYIDLLKTNVKFFAHGKIHPLCCNCPRPFTEWKE